MRRPIISGVVLAVALATAAPAYAADFRTCPRSEIKQCATVRVPIDRSGEVPGEIDLKVERVPALSGRRTGGAVFALAGGPGQAATPLTEGFGFLLEPIIGSRDLVVFDQRGTGGSGALTCPAFREEFDPAREEPDPVGPGAVVTRCAEQIGPRRAFYTTQDSADDIESVRRELGVDRISLYGTSYGTKVALAYADRYPQHLDRLVLDSAVEPRGPDALSRELLEAVPRVLRGLCREGCGNVTDDPAGDVAALVTRLAETPLRGYRVDQRGRRQGAELRREELLGFIISADFFPQVRTLLPGAVRAALAGDLAPVLRLTGAALVQDPVPEEPEVFSEALYVATICEEVPFPFDRDATPRERYEQASAVARETPEEAFYPFDRETALRLGLVELCANWPATGRELDLLPDDGVVSQAPALILSGEEDLRTPLEGAERIAARLPAATLLRVPGVGHSVLGDVLARCANRAVANFFVGQVPSGRCPVESPLGPVRPAPPMALGGLAPAKGVAGTPGRTLRATALTIDDTLLAAVVSAPLSEADPDTLVGGGLRSGRFKLSIAERDDGIFGEPFEVRLDMYSVGYVPNVRVSGRMRIKPGEELRGRVRVTGSAAAPSRLRVRATSRGYTLRGTSGGRAVDVRVKTRAP